MKRTPTTSLDVNAKSSWFTAEQIASLLNVVSDDLPNMTPQFQTQNLSHNQRRDLLQKAVYASCGDYCYVMDVYDGFLVYQEWQESGMDMYQCDYKIKKDYTVALGTPQKVIGVTSFEPINYSNFDTYEVSEDGEWVVRTGKIFECGEFPDKMFSLSEAEADEAIALFRPAQLDVEHMDTVFDGKLGSLVAVWRQGKELIGRVRL